MNSRALSLRFRWLHLPTGLLIMLLQRTPAPVVRVLALVESLVADQAAVILRSSAVAAALGAYHSVAGATVFNVTPATPASGAANANFTVTGTSGTALSIGISVSGAPGNPKSWSVKSTTPLPAGLSVTGGNPVNVVAPYKMTIAGTPTAGGTTAVTVTAWDGLNGTGGNSAKITVTFNIAGGVTSTPPSFTTQPAGQAVTAGGGVTFTVVASGSPTPTIQWKKDAVDVAGATSSTLSLTNVQASDAGTYTAVATNSAGTATSSGAVLTVSAATVAPAITTQPASQTLTAGSTATFTVAVTGSPAPTLQWKKGGTDIAGATGSTLTLASISAADAATYTVVATNSAGSATSTGAVLTVSAVAEAPAFTAQPAGQALTVGSTATFTVAVSGSPAPTIQWTKGGVALPGATGPTLTLANVQLGDAATYAAVATNSAGTATSSGAVLTVSTGATAPAFTTQPSSQVLTAGGTATFSVAVSGSPVPTLQWKKDGVSLAGATSLTLTLANLQAADAGTYVAVATNSAGTATSAGAVLIVSTSATAPTFTTQPASQILSLGGTANFTVAVAGSPTPTLQWRKGGVDIAGATGPTLTLTNVQASDAAIYTAVASNSAGTVTSSGATLTVATSAAPFITAQPLGHTVAVGNSLVLGVDLLGTGLSYQWKKGGVILNGATSRQLFLANTQLADAGSYTVTVTNSFGSTTSNAAVLTVVTSSDPGRLINASVRINSGTGADVLLMGFVTGGAGTSGTKQLLTRGIGPALLSFGVPGAMMDPVLQIIPQNSLMPGVGNDNWAGDAQVMSMANAVGAFPLTDMASKDAALVTSLPGGVYSAMVAGANGTTGVVLAELYDTHPAVYTPSSPRLINISARAPMSNANPLIAGFVVGGSTAKTILIRALGPSLTGFVGAAAMSDPQLDLYVRQSGADNLLLSNDDWGGSALMASAGASVGAFALPNPASKDAVLLVTLDPGIYSAKVTGVGNAAGITLVEIYEIP